MTPQQTRVVGMALAEPFPAKAAIRELGALAHAAVALAEALRVMLEPYDPMSDDDLIRQGDGHVAEVHAILKATGL